MRVRRKFLTALAPLIGMSALMTAMTTVPEIAKNPLTRLIHTVIQLVTPAAEISTVSAAPQYPSARAVLPLAALAPTPLGHSLWMVAGLVIPIASIGRILRAPLRC